MVHWLPILIFSQFLVVFFLAALTLGLLISRKRYAKRFQKLSNKYLDLLTNELLQPSPETNSFSQWKDLDIDREIFHQVILSQMKMVTGTEREALFNLYAVLQYKEQDLEFSKSIFWPKRLESVIHLGALEANELAPIFEEIISDPAPLVSIAALLSLSKIDHPLNSASLIKQIPSSVLNRSNALYELVANVGKHHGVKPLLNAIRTDERPRVVNACLRALRNLRSVESSEALIALLETPDTLSPDAIREIIETLTQIGDPSASPAVRIYLTHTVPSVRAKSVLFLLILNDELASARIASMRNDSDNEIKRAFQIYESLQAGASR